jgi:hypothetical protein
MSINHGYGLFAKKEVLVALDSNNRQESSVWWKTKKLPMVTYPPNLDAHSQIY